MTLPGQEAHTSSSKPPHQHEGEASTPLPSSPLSTAFHRHRPDVTPTTEDVTSYFGHQPGDQVSGSSRQAYSAEDTYLISVASPFADLESGSRRKEATAVGGSVRISELKGRIASGEWDHADRWEREGMRLVWQGRILRDGDTIGNILASIPLRGDNESHTFHLVARRIQSEPKPDAISSTPSPPLPQAGSSSSHPFDLSAATMPARRFHQALTDTIHYALFSARYHLCHLLGSEPLKWGGVVPTPTVDQPTAKAAILSIAKSLLSWELDVPHFWDYVFEDDAEGLWTKHGRGHIETDIKSWWKMAMGKHWDEGEQGSVVQIELDGLPYELNLPPLNLLSPSQLVHLLLYLRLVLTLPILNTMLAKLESTFVHPPSPTTTIRVPPHSPPARPFLEVAIDVMAGVIPILQHMVMSAVKIGAILWVFARDMGRHDVRLWIIGGAALGWWVGDVLNQVRVRRQARQQRPIAPPQVDPVLNEAQAQVAAEGLPADPVQPQAGARVVPQLRVNTDRPARQVNRNILTGLIPLVHLDVDADQLQLEGPPRRPVRVPPRWLTQFLLPMALWVITLVPEWESIRARAIRGRERAMRVRVGEMSAAPSPVVHTRELPNDNDEPIDGQEGQNGRTEQEGPSFSGALGANLARRRVRVYPQGLNPIAKRYYERVMERGEGIDWEEEREVQRAMGIADEDEADQGGMRMGML